ncbi:hypothetical protein BA190_27670 [Labrys sp. WJW]|uniref:regulatory protein GemA n=1 Tax=Labrys sp. WJW TaxID=1737983 RepID=UPI00083157C5|nr:regulatory protein GemA [Labrys sp. WJW]OCC01743.1 hypothetical protein BA190_27670 [Labrys sp. WJW]
MSAIARIHMLKSRAGLDDAAYRDLLQAATGQRSSKGLSPDQELRVIAQLEGLSKGAPARSGSAQRATGDYAPKLQALWMALHDLGMVENRTDKAMMAFVERQTGLSHTRFLTDPVDSRKAIEALKKMAQRAGAEWKPERVAKDMGLTQLQADRWAILIAQAKILRDRGADATVQRIAFADINKPLSPEQLLERQILLGRHIRELIGGEA